MCCPSYKVIKSDARSCLGSRRVIFHSYVFFGYTNTNYATLCKQWHRPMSKRFIKLPYSIYIESNLDRLRLLSRTHGQCSQQQSEQMTLQSVLINKPKFLKATYHTEVSRKIETSRSTSGSPLWFSWYHQNLLTLERDFESRRSHTNWDFLSHHAQQVENDHVVVHKIRLHGRRGKGMAESFSQRKMKAGTAEGRWRK